MYSKFNTQLFINEKRPEIKGTKEADHMGGIAHYNFSHVYDSLILSFIF